MPANLEDAERRRNALTLEVQDLQTQLGEKVRLGADGRRLSHTQYWLWRDDAQRQLTNKLNELRELKTWIRSQPRPIADPTNETLRHLTILHRLITQLAADGVHLDGLEVAIMRDAGEHLRRAGVLS